MSNWRNLGVRKYAGWGDSPPHFLFKAGEGSYEETFLRELSEVWEFYRDLLDEGDGYSTLKELKSDLKERRVEIEERARRYQAKEKFGKLAIRDLEEEARTHAVMHDLDNHEFGHGEGELNWEDALSLPISDYLEETQGNHESTDPIARLVNRWKVPSATSHLWTCVQLPDREISDPRKLIGTQKPRIAVIYRPPDGHLRSHLEDPDSLQKEDRSITFWASDTWEEAIEKVKNRLNPEEAETEGRIKSWSQHRERLKRTLSMIDFRLTVLDNVLYQFEVFGSVEQMGDEAGRTILSRFSPSDEAAEVFRGKRRISEVSAPNVDEKVKEWAIKSFEYFHTEAGMGRMEARKEVLGLAEAEGYEFSLRILEEWTQSSH